MESVPYPWTKWHGMTQFVLAWMQGISDFVSSAHRLVPAWQDVDENYPQRSLLSLRVMLKIMKPKCDRMVMKHENSHFDAPASFFLVSFRRSLSQLAIKMARPVQNTPEYNKYDWLASLFLTLRYRMGPEHIPVLDSSRGTIVPQKYVKLHRQE